MAATSTTEGLVNILSQLMGGDGSYFRVRLYRNNVVIAKTITLGALAEATFDGYAAYASSLWSVPVEDDNEDVFTLSPAIVFQRAAGIVDNIIYGAYLTLDDGVGPTRLLQVEAFTVPVPMSLITDQIPLRWLFNSRNIAA